MFRSFFSSKRALIPRSFLIKNNVKNGKIMTAYGFYD